MNSLMQTMQNNNKTSKPSLKNLNSINVSALRGSGLNDSIYGSGALRNSSPLTREIGKAHSGYRESAGENK